MSTSQYQFSLQGNPEFGMAEITLQSGQSLKVEAGAMATMDPNVSMRTRLKGGLGRLLTGESLFVNEFTAQGGAGRITVAPASPGALHHLVLGGETLFLQSSAFVAASPEVVLETKWQGFTKGFFSGESLFLIRASGTGDVWFNTFGALLELDVTDGLVVDTGAIAAFTGGLDYSIRKFGGYKSLFFSGEGFVCEFRGQGKVWIQTRQPSPFAGAFLPFRPRKRQASGGGD